MVSLVCPHFPVFCPGADGMGVCRYLAFPVQYMCINGCGWFVPPAPVVAVLVEQVMLVAKAVVCDVSFYG